MTASDIIETIISAGVCEDDSPVSEETMFVGPSSLTTYCTHIDTIKVLTALRNACKRGIEIDGEFHGPFEVKKALFGVREKSYISTCDLFVVGVDDVEIDL